MVLVGLSGAGKSTAGESAAKLLGIPFLDLDAQIVACAGKTIAEIFEADGEESFREMETAATETALRSEPGIIAAGAGWIASPRNRALLLSRGRIIYLRVTVDTAVKRLGEAHSRPKLAGGATIEILRRMEAERTRLYEAADAVLDTEGLSLQQVTQKLAALTRSLERNTKKNG